MRCDGDASTEEEELGPDDSLLCGCFDLKITEKEEFFGRKCPAHLCKPAHSQVPWLSHRVSLSDSVIHLV